MKLDLTERQRAALANAWFYFGSLGTVPRTGNYQFIWGLLEHGRDERSMYDVTPACLMSIDSILATP